MSDVRVAHESEETGARPDPPKPTPPASQSKPATKALTDEQLFRAMGFTPGYLARKRETVPKDHW